MSRFLSLHPSTHLLYKPKRSYFILSKGKQAPLTLDSSQIYTIVVSMFLILLVRLLFFEHSKLLGYFASALTQSSIYSLVFEKIQRVDLRAVSLLNIGHIINNITNDVVRAHIFIVTVRQLLNAPLMVLLFSVLLYVEVGAYALAGIGLVIIMLLLILLIGKLMARASQAKLKFSTARNHEMTFVLAGMKSVKFNCWEHVVLDKIRRLKKRENKFIFFLNSFRNISEGLGNVIPSVAGFITIVLYNVVNEEQMRLERVFFVLSIFNTLITPLKQFFFCYSNMEITRVSLGRIQKLLCLPDFTEGIQSQDLQKGEIRLDRCTMSYHERTFYDKIIADFKKNEYSKIKNETTQGGSSGEITL